MLVDLMTLDICGMVAGKLTDRVAERAGVIWHRHQQLCVRLHCRQRAYNNVAPVYCRNALDHCKHACQMTPALSATRSASLRVTIEQISTIRRSIGVHRSAIRCNVHDCIDLYGVEYPGSCCNDAMMWIVPVDDSGGLCVPNQ